MASNTLTYSGYAIYYEEHKAYLDHTGRHYDMICEDCIWQDGHFIPQALAKAVRWVRKVFGGNIYVVRVEIKAEKANRHQYEETMSYSLFKQTHEKRTQSDVEKTLALCKKIAYELYGEKMSFQRRSSLTWIKYCKRYLNENFYNKPKKEVNDGRE